MGSWESDFGAAFARKLLASSALTARISGRVRRGELADIALDGDPTYPLVCYTLASGDRTADGAAARHARASVRVWVWTEAVDRDNQHEILELVRTAVHQESITYGGSAFVLHCDATAHEVPRAAGTRTSAVVVDWTVQGVGS